jgi:hypothetical protein
MTTRLGTVAADLVDLVLRASADTARQIAASAAEYAVDMNSLTDRTITVALAAARKGTTGEQSVRTAVEELAEALDERQWNVQARVESGEADEEQHLKAFRAARAAAAVRFALDDDPVKAALEATYEAHAATGDLQELRKIIGRVTEN